MNKIEEHAGIQIPIYYHEDENGNRVYDYEGMADEFEQELSMLDQDVKVVVSVEDRPDRNESIPKCTTKHFADGFHEGRWEDDDIQKQAYIEMTSDGLPVGGDAQAVLESHKLADEIVDNQKGKWIYESPDGGKTVFRRPFADYDMSKKEEIDWETKEPTGRIFTDYPFEEKDDEG